MSIIVAVLNIVVGIMVIAAGVLVNRRAKSAAEHAHLAQEAANCVEEIHKSVHEALDKFTDEQKTTMFRVAKLSATIELAKATNNEALLHQTLRELNDIEVERFRASLDVTGDLP